jgi:hypothetical protein
MPYTPPSQLSPATSKQPSPTPSRSHSYIKGNFLAPEQPASSGRPNLPRSNGSSSYLTKHRRSPSLNETKNSEVLHNGEAYEENGVFDPHGSIRQSPPPVNNSQIPVGMTISPPDSSQNSSDDEEQPRGRSRDLEAANLQALHAAISSIQSRKSTGSPTRTGVDDSTISEPTVSRLDGTRSAGPQLQRPPLSQEARKISHSRSSTDSNIMFESPQKQMASPVSPSVDTDESDSDNGPSGRPPMLRKKSGELVRPALRPSSRRRPSSMPGTPTYSKAVHFDSHLEHVRHFLQVDRPLAVSAGSSPVENYESENEFPFGGDESTARPRTPTFEWTISLANFPADSESRRSQPVFVERIFLSSDNKHMIGTIAVQNLAFHKAVAVRFTLDYWKTTSEIAAEYNNDLNQRSTNENVDRFNFSIKLADQANLENKTLFFCARYSVNGQEYWDNNGSFNYQVDFSKKQKSTQPKKVSPGLGERPLSALPRSRPSPPTSSGRPVSMPASFDDFSSFDNFGSSYSQSAGAIIGEPKLKLRSPRSRSDLVPEAPQRRRNGGPEAFGRRYDFSSSLTAAKNYAYGALGESSGLIPAVDTKQSSQIPATIPAQTATNAPAKHENAVNGIKAGANSTAPLTSKPTTLVSEKPDLGSQTYQEIVDKYCFVGTRGQEEVKTH